MRRMISDTLQKYLKQVKDNYPDPSNIGGKTNLEVENITTLTNAQINNLNAGDIVVKKTGNQKHTYVVTYKENGQGICLSYFDAGYLETVSYDFVNDNWTYNSTDVVNVIEDYALKTDVPTTATSTVTPTTETLTFTYSDNTTGTITFLTAATVTTTLS